MFDLIVKLVENWHEIAKALAEIGAGITALAAIASTQLPPASKPGAYATLRKVVNLAGQNYGYAKNATDHKPPAPFV